MNLEQTVSTIADAMVEAQRLPDEWSEVRTHVGVYMTTKELDSDRHITLSFFPVRKILMFSYYDANRKTAVNYDFWHDGTINTSDIWETAAGNTEKLQFYPVINAIHSLEGLANAIVQSFGSESNS